MTFELTARVAPDSARRLSASLTKVLACHKSLHTSLMIRHLVFAQKKHADLIMIMPHWRFLTRRGRSITHRQGRLGKLSRRSIGVNDPPQGLRDGLYVLGCAMSCGVLFHLKWCERHIGVESAR